MSKRPAAAGAEVRAAAARIVALVAREHRSLDDALAAAPELPERDMALLRALTFGACRWHHRLEWQASRLLSRPLAPRDAELAALLRLGLFQLQSLRVPDHAAVSATVAAATLLGAGRAKGLVNAVLRRFMREREGLVAEMADHPEALFSHPDWIIASLRADWPADAAAILEADNAAPPMWLRVNARRSTREAYLARLAGAGITAGASAVVPSAVLLAEPQPMTRLPGYDEGEVSVQDAAAQLAADLVDLRPGQRVLDACAAPGGKTAHMLERCPGLAELWAVDRDPERLAAVRGTLDRLGLTARLVHGDATLPTQWWDGVPFDRILIDAPCSALGVIRRHPDIKLLRSPRDVQHVTALQAALLEALWPLLRPGGRLVYATCTVLHRENRDRIEHFVAATADARPAEVRLPAALGAGRGAWQVQIRPGEANMDGFYYACVDKQETPPPFRESSRHQ